MAKINQIESNQIKSNQITVFKKHAQIKSPHLINGDLNQINLNQIKSYPWPAL